MDIGKVLEIPDKNIFKTLLELDYTETTGCDLQLKSKKKKNSDEQDSPTHPHL